MSTRSLPYGMRVGLLCILYVATAKFGLSLDAMHGFAAAVWPPTGIALGALVLGGYRLWPGIALGAFLVNVPPVQVVPLLCNKFKLDVSFPKPLFIFLVLF
jgi:integral membrane sensor domain MASE1